MGKVRAADLHHPLVARLRDQREAVRRLAAASRFARSGLSVPAEGVTAVDGDLQALSFAAGSAGWRLRSGGDAEFNDVTIRGAAIGIDAPVLQETARAAATNFSLATSFVEKTGVNVTVPDGCTRLKVAAFARLFCFNPHTSGGADGLGTDAIYVQADVDGSASTATPTGISGNGGFATTNGFDSFDLDGYTPGQTVRVGAWAACSYAAIAANAGNYVSVVAALTWLR